MQLLTIRAAGFTATVDACAQDGGQVWFLSLLGNQQSVRALWARLVKGETAYLSEDELGGGSPCWLASEAWGTWRFHSARLPSGAAHHGLLVPEDGGGRPLMRWESPLTAVKAVVARPPALRSRPALERRMTAARLAALRRSGGRTAPSS